MRPPATRRWLARAVRDCFPDDPNPASLIFPASPALLLPDRGASHILKRMARRIVHQLVDDIDGTLLEVGEGETIHFSLNGIAYEIDLTNAHADELREALDPYIKAGRRASAGNARSAAPRRRSARNSEVGEIREWAKAQGLKVSERGRISADVMDAYRAAH